MTRWSPISQRLARTASVIARHHIRQKLHRLQHELEGEPDIIGVEIRQDQIALHGRDVRTPFFRAYLAHLWRKDI